MAKTSKDLVNHSGQMLDGIKPEFTATLFLGDIIMCHANNGLPIAFDKAV